MLRPDDVVILHDPQTAGMLPALRAAADVPLIWRAHIGLDLPNDLAREAWSFLTPTSERADAYVFSREAFAWEGLDPARVIVIPPSIDAFAPKNHAMAFSSVTAVLRAAGPGRATTHQRQRAVFERLDGSVGFVAATARRWSRRQPLRLDSPLRGAGLALGPPQGSARRAGRVRRARPREPEPHLLLAGPDVTRRHGRPGGRRGVRRGRGRVARAAAGRAPPGPPRAAADGGRRRERRDRQRAPAARRRRRAEEPRRGLRAHRRRGDVEGTARRRDARSAGSRTRSRTAAPAVSSSRTTSPAFGERVSALLGDPHAAERMGEAARAACATCSSARATSASTSTCSRVSRREGRGARAPSAGTSPGALDFPPRRARHCGELRSRGAGHTDEARRSPTNMSGDAAQGLRGAHSARSRSTGGICMSAPPSSPSGSTTSPRARARCATCSAARAPNVAEMTRVLGPGAGPGGLHDHDGGVRRVHARATARRPTGSPRRSTTALVRLETRTRADGSATPTTRCSSPSAAARATRCRG